MLKHDAVIESNGAHVSCVGRAVAEEHDNSTNGSPPLAPLFLNLSLRGRLVGISFVSHDVYRCNSKENLA